jgi:aspartate kinase
MGPPLWFAAPVVDTIQWSAPEVQRPVALIVQKYGGTSVADAERIKDVARRVAARRAQGDQLVVVVSAMGDTTDRLLELARQVSDQPEARELDVLLSTGETVSMTLLAMALHALHVDAVSLSGAQAGLRTDTVYGRARILAIDPGRVRRELDRGRVVIVAGFQGITDELDVTTLGRGGSDTTAVALAAALRAKQCEIYTDVDGVYTTDPRVEPAARKLRDISYEEMLELAAVGAKVLHPRAVELGAVYDIPIIVASSFADAPGTLIHGGVEMEQFNKVRGIAHDLDVAKVTVRGVPDRPGIAASIFEPLAEHYISVDTIVQNASEENLTDLTFTVASADLPKAAPIVERVAKEIGAREVVADDGWGKVSIVGTGMQSAPGYAARMFRTLSDEGINIEMISTGEIRITCIVRREDAERAVRALHRAFELEKAEPEELSAAT